MAKPPGLHLCLAQVFTPRASFWHIAHIAEGQRDIWGVYQLASPTDWVLLLPVQVKQLASLGSREVELWCAVGLQQPEPGAGVSTH